MSYTNRTNTRKRKRSRYSPEIYKRIEVFQGVRGIFINRNSIVADSKFSVYFVGDTIKIYGEIHEPIRIAGEKYNRKISRSKICYNTETKKITENSFGSDDFSILTSGYTIPKSSGLINLTYLELNDTSSISYISDESVRSLSKFQKFSIYMFGNSSIDCKLPRPNLEIVMHDKSKIDATLKSNEGKSYPTTIDCLELNASGKSRLIGVFVTTKLDICVKSKEVGCAIKIGPKCEYTYLGQAVKNKRLPTACIVEKVSDNPMYAMDELDSNGLRTITITRNNNNNNNNDNNYSTSRSGTSFISTNSSSSSSSSSINNNNNNNGGFGGFSTISGVPLLRLNNTIFSDSLGMFYNAGQIVGGIRAMRAIRDNLNRHMIVNGRNIITLNNNNNNNDIQRAINLSMQQTNNSSSSSGNNYRDSFKVKEDTKNNNKFDEIKPLGEGENCSICKSNLAVYIAIPCGHYFSCEDCIDANKLHVSKCVYCRKPIKQSIKMKANKKQKTYDSNQQITKNKSISNNNNSSSNNVIILPD